MRRWRWCLRPRRWSVSPTPPGLRSGVNGANELIASLDADGKVCLFTSQSTHLIVDVVGHLS